MAASARTAVPFGDLLLPKAVGVASASPIVELLALIRVRVVVEGSLNRPARTLHLGQLTRLCEQQYGQSPTRQEGLSFRDAGRAGPELTLHVRTRLLTILTALEVVTVAPAASIHELHADTLSPVVPPSRRRFGARAVVLGCEADVCGKVGMALPRWAWPGRGQGVPSPRRVAGRSRVTATAGQGFVADPPGHALLDAVSHRRAC